MSSCQFRHRFGSPGMQVCLKERAKGVVVTAWVTAQTPDIDSFSSALISVPVFKSIVLLRGLYEKNQWYI